MPTEAEYRSAIRSLNHAGLLGLWEEIESFDTPNWDPGKAIEYLVLRAFELEGAEITWPYRVALDGEEVEQIDGVIYLSGLFCIVESKQHERKINVEPITKLRNQLADVPLPRLG